MWFSQIISGAGVSVSVSMLHSYAHSMKKRLQEYMARLSNIVFWLKNGLEISVTANKS